MDRKYIRTCAVYKLLKRGTIKRKTVALDLLRQVHGERSKINLTLEIWLRSPELRHVR